MDDCSARRGPPTAAVECVRRLFRRCLQHRRVHCPRGSTRCLFCLPQRRSMRPAAKNDPRIREIRVIRLESADNLNSPVGWMEHGSQRAQPAGSLPGLTLPSTNWLSPFRAIVSASEITTPRCWSSNWPFFFPPFFLFRFTETRLATHAALEKFHGEFRRLWKFYPVEPPSTCYFVRLNNPLPVLCERYNRANNRRWNIGRVEERVLFFKLARTCLCQRFLTSTPCSSACDFQTFSIRFFCFFFFFFFFSNVQNGTIKSHFPHGRRYHTRLYAVEFNSSTFRSTILVTLRIEKRGTFVARSLDTRHPGVRIRPRFRKSIYRDTAKADGKIWDEPCDSKNSWERSTET